MKLSIALLLLASAAFADTTDTVFLPDIQIMWTGPGNASASPTDTLSSTSNGYTLTATGCFDGWCPGQTGSGSIPTFTINDPITARGTAVTLTCTQAPGCSHVETIDFLFTFEPVTPAAGTTLPVTFSVDGTAPNHYNLGVEAEVFGTTVISSGAQTVTADSSGNFSKSFNLGNITLAAFNKVNLSFTVNGLKSGQSITFPSSETVQLGASVPEPGSLALLVAVLGGVGWIARKRRA